MSDATDNDTLPGPEQEGPGVSLRRAREARGLRVRDIAQELHLDAWMIEALEADEFDALGAPVFAKGHLRQYGALLGLAADDLMIAYYRVRGRHDAPPPPITSLMTQPRTRAKSIWAALALAVLVLGALAILLWFLSGRNSAAPDVAPVSNTPALPPVALELATSLPDSAALPAADAQRADDTGEAASDDVAGEPVSVESVETADSDGTAPPENLSVAVPVETPLVAAVETITLELTFDGDSWVEVYNNDGDRLIYGMYDAGTSRRVRGVPPIEIYLGRGRDVSLAVNGRAYPVPAQSIRGNTARFVIEAGTR